MAIPTLTGLPTELLAQIIPHVIPEGLESLALTCRIIYELCAPFFERHNHLRSEFRRFKYREASADPLSSPIRTAFDLIVRIAIEPIVSRYIVDADFNRDSFPPRARPSQFVTNNQRDALATLLADSPYLPQACLDCEEFYTLIGEGLKHYSQNAAVFILTLLPNVKTLRLPRLWTPTDKTEKLLEVIVRETKQPRLRLERPSLAQVTSFESFSVSGAGHRFDLDKAIPFLALPHVQAFRGPASVAIGDASMALASREPYLCYGETLEVAHLVSCCIDEVAIAEFLKHTPRLRTLKYSHCTRLDGEHQDWDICKFVTAIEREAGSSLEEFSVSIRELRSSIAPGKASMRGFQRLQKLEFPLELAMCNVNDAASRTALPTKGSTTQEPEKLKLFIGDFVPASVSQLSLLSSGTDHHEKALQVMFRDFAAKKDAQLPALKDIHLSCPVSPSADDAYKEECAKLDEETRKAGVVLHLEEWPSSISMTWYGAS